MRFPRLFAFYRSYPEFDGYPDEQCRKLVLLARMRRGDAAWVMPLLASIGINIVWTVIGAGLLIAVAGVSGRVLPAPALFLTPILLFQLPALIVAYIWVRRIMLVRSIRRMIHRAVCPFCEFSLRGLPIKVNAVICPECGQKVQLSAHGIRREDLDLDAPDLFAPLPPPARTPSKPVSPLSKGR